MKIIYYSTAYYAKHGGSNHSKAFVAECEKHPLVEEIIVFPDHSKKEVKNVHNVLNLKSRIRKNGFIQIFNFFRRNNFHYTQLIEVIRNVNPDVVHIRLDSNFLQIGKLRKEFPDLKITTEVNASPFDESFKNIQFKPYFGILEKKLLSKSNLNFFVSSFLRKRVMGELLDAKRDLVVHNGVDLRKFKPKELKRQSERTVTIGYIGTLDIHKNIDILLQAIHVLNQKGLAFEFMIVGDGPARKELEHFAAKLSLKNTAFLGWKSHDEIPAQLDKFDIAVHHHAQDYMSPLKIFEYMAAKVPCIGPDTSAVKEVFEDRKDLILTNGTVEDLVLKIEELIVDEKLRAQLSEAAYNLVSSHYTWEANVNFIVEKMADMATKKA